MGSSCSIHYTEEEESAILSNMLVPIVWIIGSPGAGRTTICDKLVQRFKLWRVSASKIIEEEVHHLCAKRRKQLQRILNNNELIPRDLIIQLIREEMIHYVNRATGFLIDGYPKNVDQAIKFEEKSSKPSLILYLQCSIPIAHRRLRDRYPGACTLREPEDSIKKRIKEFHNHIEPILEQYKGRIITVDADKDIQSVYQVCRGHIEQLLNVIGIEIPDSPDDI